MLNDRNQAKPASPGVSIEGVRINLPTLRVAADEAIRRAARGEGFTLFTVNLDHLVKLASNEAFRGVYRRATYVTADGWPVVWLAGRKNAKLERATGADLVEPLCQAAAARDLGVYFVGPGPKAQAGALEKLTQRFKGLRIAGAEAPQLPSGAGPAKRSSPTPSPRAARAWASSASARRSTSFRARLSGPPGGCSMASWNGSGAWPTTRVAWRCATPNAPCCSPSWR